MDAYQLERLPIKKDVAILAVLFVVGLGVGLIASRLLVGEPQVSESDYAVLVARVYQREQSVPLATERLQAVGIGRAADAVSAMASNHPTATPDEQRDAESLRELARALGKPVADTAAVPKEPPQIWVLSLVVLILALVLGSLLAFRILGVKLPNLDAAARGLGIRSPQAGRRVAPVRKLTPTAASQVNGNGHGLAAVETARPIAGHGEPEEGQIPSLAPDEVSISSEPAPREPVPGTRPLFRPSPMLGGVASPARGSDRQLRELAGARTLTISPAQASFRTSYGFGDEPYDEIHPILDRRNKTLAGACGVSAAREMSDEGPTRYWAFTAWVHDYVSQKDQLKSVGLVSKWAYEHFGDEIDEWLGSGEVDEVRQVEYGQVARLETSNLAVDLSIEEYDFGDELPSDGYFARLAAKFDVEIRRES